VEEVKETKSIEKGMENMSISKNNLSSKVEEEKK